jgi:hypothetical protein
MRPISAGNGLQPAGSPSGLAIGCTAGTDERPGSPASNASGTLPAPAPPPDLKNQPGEEWRMAMQVRTSGCLYSIIASVVLTILLNVMLRGCAG